MTGFDLFPIQLDDVIRTVPWGLMEPHEAQAKRNHSGQTLEQLAARGGVMPEEALAIIEGRPWERMARTAASLMLKEYAEAFMEGRKPRVGELVTPMQLGNRAPTIDPAELIASGEYYLGAPVRGPDILARLDKAISLAVRVRSVIGPGSRHTCNELVATLEGIKLEIGNGRT